MQFVFHEMTSGTQVPPGRMTSACLEQVCIPAAAALPPGRTTFTSPEQLCIPREATSASLGIQLPPDRAKEDLLPPAGDKAFGADVAELLLTAFPVAGCALETTTARLDGRSSSRSLVACSCERALSTVASEARRQREEARTSCFWGMHSFPEQLLQGDGEREGCTETPYRRWPFKTGTGDRRTEC
jgi:hypothetical protein